MKRWVAVRLKVPDNTAYTAMVALRRLNVPVARVERTRLVLVEGENEAAALERVERDQELFNPNLHESYVLSAEEPAAGEVHVWPRNAKSELWSWRLTDERGAPLDNAALQRARDVLLCNPATEEAALPA